jgi:hypothetical protein
LTSSEFRRASSWCCTACRIGLRPWWRW